MDAQNKRKTGKPVYKWKRRMYINEMWVKNQGWP
jgi:hypothetical protein